MSAFDCVDCYSQAPLSKFANACERRESFPTIDNSMQLFSAHRLMSTSLVRSRFVEQLHSVRRCPAFVVGRRFYPTLNQIRRGKARTKRRRAKARVVSKAKRVLIGPQRRGVVAKVFTRKPKKPNSAQRKVALVRLSSGRSIQCYMPGEKASLQEHAVVLIQGGRVQDLPGVKYSLIRGKYDFAH